MAGAWGSTPPALQGLSEHPWEEHVLRCEIRQQLGQIMGLGSSQHPHITNLAAAEL